MLAGILFGLFLFLLQGKISFRLVLESSWFCPPIALLRVRPTFSLPAILSLICTYLAVMINTVGSIQGTSEVVGKEDLEDRIHRGIGMTGVGGWLRPFSEW